MTDVLDAPTPTRARRRDRVRGALATALGPLWVRTFRDPYVEGRLRLDGLGRAEQQAARIGLVTLAVLLVSVLFVDVWRSGPLLNLALERSPAFVPAGLLPVTLLGFLVAWLLVVWGALTAAPVVRVLVALGFLFVNATLGVPSTVTVGDSWILAHGPLIARIGYFVPAGVLLVSALVSALLRWLPAASRSGRGPVAERWLTAVLRLATLVGLAMFYLGLLAMHLAFVAAGFRSEVQSLVSGTITEVNALLLPVVYVSAVAVIDFALDVSTSATEPARALPLRWARRLLLVLVAVKLWVEVGAETDYWASYLTHQPTSLVRTVLAVALLALVVAGTTRFARTEALEDAKERLMYVAGGALAVPFLLSILFVGLGIVVVAQLRRPEGVELAAAVPDELVATWLPITLSALAIVVGAWALRRPGPLAKEVGSGMVVLGVWNLPVHLIDAAGYRMGFSYPAVDVLVTLGVLAILLVRWRRLDLTGVVVLGTVTLFSWLVMSQGDYIAYLGGLLGLPEILVVVFGIVYILASDSGFAAESSPRLPARSRKLVYVGYLLMSVTILHWTEASHLSSSDADTLAGFYFLGIPLAAWLLGRAILPRPAATPAPSPSAVPAAPAA